MKNRLLYHVDDFGRTNKINLSIHKTIRKGNTNSISVMVGQSGDDGASKIIKKLKNINIRLHINLTDGKSITKDGNATNENNFFKFSFVDLFFAPLKSNFKEKKETVEKEILAQIKHFKLKYKVKVLKIDGHQHVHLIPWILNLIIDISNKKYKVKEIRIVNESFFFTKLADIFKKFYIINFIKFSILKFLSLFAKSKLKRAEIPYNYKFMGVLYSGYMNIQSIEKYIKILRRNNIRKPIEILMHPNVSNISESKEFLNESMHKYYLLKKRKEEFNLIVSEKLKKVCEPYENFINSR